MYQPPVQMEEFAHTSYNTPGQPQNLPHLPMTQDQFTPVYKPPESVRQYHGPQPLGISFALGDQLLDAQNQPLTHFEQPFADQEQLPKQANQEQPPPNQTNQAVQVVPGQTSSTRRSSTSSSTCTTEKVNTGHLSRSLPLPNSPPPHIPPPPPPPHTHTHIHTRTHTFRLYVLLLFSFRCSVVFPHLSLITYPLGK